MNAEPSRCGRCGKMGVRLVAIGVPGHIAAVVHYMNVCEECYREAMGEDLPAASPSVEDGTVTYSGDTMLSRLLGHLADLHEYRAREAEGSADQHRAIAYCSCQLAVDYRAAKLLIPMWRRRRK